jgi:adenylate kinase
MVKQIKLEECFMRNFTAMIVLVISSWTSFSALAAPNFVLVGAPGSGKGTMGKALSDHYGIPHISSGDIVRAEIAAGTPFGLKVKEMMAAGKLLPDTPEFMGEVFEALKRRLQEPSASNGFILDGIPRNALQAIRLESVLNSIGRKIDHVLLMDVSEETLVDRVMGRLICKGCGMSYHMTSRPPKVEGLCDECFQPLVKRPDDNPIALAERIRDYNHAIGPVIEFYHNQGRLIELNGERDSSLVLQSIIEEVDRKQKLSGQPVFDRDFLKKIIPFYPHHEIAGLQMYNLIEMYKDPAVLRYIVQKFNTIIQEKNPDYVATTEARGLPVFGAVIYESNKPGIFIRKAGKLPVLAPKIQKRYTTAYSEDALELVKDPALVGKTVVYLDDGISSGGTTLASIQVLEQAGMKVIGVVAIIQYSYRKLCEEFLAHESSETLTTLFDF